LSGALDREGSPFIGSDAGAFSGQLAGVAIQSEFDKGLAGAEFLIDFTRPEGTLRHLEYCAAHGIKMIIGTTGFDDAGKAAIRAAAEKTAIVFAPNMSIGVNVTLKLLEMAAKNFSEGYDIEIIEAHHRHKVDAPSGTALKMGEVIADALGRDLKDCAVYGREGVTGERDPSTIGFATVRGGDIVGDHTVLFAGVSRSATSRAAGSATPRVRCAPRASWPTSRPACTTCRTCSGSRPERRTVRLSRRSAGILVAP
jgi:4-hydroxy-tetrahydrodipicolinate reductase